MPTYEYRCLDCHEVWERRENIAEHEDVTGQAAAPPPCPACKSDRVEPVISAFFAKTSRKS
jgi:putative FmdB family regulatory protein